MDIFVPQDPLVGTPTIILRRCHEDNLLQYQEMSVYMEGREVVKDDPNFDIHLALACLIISTT